jgi:hypothetical protein
MYYNKCYIISAHVSPDPFGKRPLAWLNIQQLLSKNVGSIWKLKLERAMSPGIQNKAFFPALTIVGLVTIPMGFLIIFQLLTHEDLQYVPWRRLGADYYDFYSASKILVSGQSPYQHTNYVTPPLPAILNSILTFFSWENARNIFLVIVVVSIVAAYTIAYKIFRSISPLDNQMILLCGIVTILFSYPFHFLLVRGNIDGLVVLLLCLGLYLDNRNKQWLSGLCLALAIATKVYPLLILLPLLARRRWKVILSISVCVGLLLLMFPQYWTEYFLGSRSNRIGYFRVSQNGSIVNTLLPFLATAERLLGQIGIATNLISYNILYSMLLYLVLLALMFYSDAKWGKKYVERDHTSGAMMYFPFMVAIPPTVYHYELVILLVLIPLACSLWRQANSKKSKLYAFLITLGIGLGQWQAIVLYELTQNAHAYRIPGFGLLLVMIGCTLFKFNAYEVTEQIGLNKSKGVIRPG